MNPNQVVGTNAPLDAVSATWMRMQDRRERFRQMVSAITQTKDDELIARGLEVLRPLAIEAMQRIGK